MRHPETHFILLALHLKVVEDESRSEVDEEWNQAVLDDCCSAAWKVFVEERTHNLMAEYLFTVLLPDASHAFSKPATILVHKAQRQDLQLDLLDICMLFVFMEYFVDLLAGQKGCV